MDAKTQIQKIEEQWSVKGTISFSDNQIYQNQVSASL